MFSEPQRSAHGLYAVSWRENFVAWLAWRQWLSSEMNWHFFPEQLSVPTAWPPTSQEGARYVASKIAEGRKAADSGGHTNPDPHPWDEWSNAEKQRLAREESRRRKEWDSLFTHAPRYPIDPHRWSAASPMKGQKQHPFRGPHNEAAE